MALQPTGIIRLGILALASLLAATGVSAQFSKLDDLAKRIATELKPLKPNLVAIADFRPADGTALPQGHYFAWILSGILQDRGKNKFTVADHIGFDSDLAKLNIPVTSLVPEAFQSAAQHLGVDVLITGTVEKRDHTYVLQVIPIRVSQAKFLQPLQLRIEVTEFLGSFITPFPESVRHANRSMDVPDLTMPSCIYCPDPSYTDLARRNHLQGRAVFEVLISANGRPSQIRPVHFLGNGLDEEAFEAIKRWRFKPATLKEDGSPVPSIVPIEVTFRLF